MWTTLGLVGLVLACAIAWFLRGGRAWRGQVRDGYEMRANSHKGTLRSLEIGVHTRTALEFELRREGGFDRFAKAIGLSVEAQVGRAGFDDALYLVADVPRVPSALRADRTLADALQALFALGHPDVERTVRLICRKGTLVLTVATRALPSEAADRVAAELAPAVVVAAERLAAYHPGTPPPDPLVWRATLVLAIASGLLAHGLLDAARVGLGWAVRTLDVAQLWLYALPVAAAAVLALLLLGMVLLGGSSRAHRVLIEALLLAVVGAPLGAMAELRDLNIEADMSPREQFDVRVISKSVHRSSKGGRTYYVELSGWPARPDGDKIMVRGDEFDLYLVGHPVTLVQRRGYLHLRWLESVTPEPP